MRRIALCAFVLCFTLTFMASFSVFGQENSNYVVVKGGIYSPTGDLDDLDNGSAAEVVFGHYYSPTLALEGGIGFFDTDGSESAVIPPFGLVTADVDVSVTTFFLTLKGFRPIKRGELYLGGGIGLGFVDVDIDVSGGFGSVSASDDDRVYAIQILAGGNFNITDKCFLGVEGKHIWTDETSEIFGIEANGDGFIVTGVLGFRF